MKIFDPSRHLPPGWEWEGTRTGLIWGHIASGLPLFSFLNRYSDALEALYSYREQGNQIIRELNPDRTIAPFSELIRGTPLLGLWIFLAVMPLLVWRYYHFHTQGAMSIYTMRRLPDPREYHRRCWMQPLLSAAAELLLFAILIGLCWLLWYFGTPAVCLPG